MMRSASRQALDTLREQESAGFGGRVSADTADLDRRRALRRRRPAGRPAAAAAPAGRPGQRPRGPGRACSRRLFGGKVGQADARPGRRGREACAGPRRGISPTRSRAPATPRCSRPPRRATRSTGSRTSCSASSASSTPTARRPACSTSGPPPPARRNELLDSLVAGKVSPITLALLHHAVASQRKRSITLAIDDLLETGDGVASSVRSPASSRPFRSPTRSSSASPPRSPRSTAGRSASVPRWTRNVQGGLIVRVGDEVIDGSVATRFAAARTALAG